MKRIGRRDRRRLLRRALAVSLTALAGLAARHARAQAASKPTKEQASYQDRAVSHTCAECALFLPPNDCKVIQGPVSPDGTCIYFSH